MSDRRPSGAAALMVAAGIFLSRIAGFVRSRALAHYLGNSDAADAFTYALRIPNLLQNLFGEGVLSASFIPVYVRLIEEKREAEARRMAGAVAALLAGVVAIIVAVGVLGAPVLVDLFAPGYAGEKRDVCVRLVRIVFPGTGLLVLSAFCLGVLNSHRRFFLSYVAPVLWNFAIIGALVIEGRRGQGGYPLAVAAAVGAVAGSALQLFVQLPTVLWLLRGLGRQQTPPPAGRPASIDVRAHVRSVGASFVPVVLGRGVIQISSWVDSVVASFLLTGAMAGLNYAQMLYQLPIAIFGMAVSASELPEMARATGDDAAIAAKLGPRLAASMRRIAFFVVPSAIVFLALGDVVVALVYRTGRFGAAEGQFVWAILAGFALGLVAATQARLLSSALYALRDANTPFRIAIKRVLVGTALGVGLAFGLPAALDIERRWGVVGLALASALASWLEYALLRRALTRRISVKTTLPLGFIARITLASLIAGAAGLGTKVAIAAFLPLHPALSSALVLAIFGASYLAVAAGLRVDEAHSVVRRIARLLRLG